MPAIGSNRLFIHILNKGINLSITDKRKKIDGDYVSEKFKSKEGLKEFISFLDENREPLIADVISMAGEKNTFDLHER